VKSVLVTVIAGLLISAASPSHAELPVRSEVAIV
jgi:hypothetical protein